MAEKVEKNFLKYGIYSEFVPSVEGSGLFAGREIPARKEVGIYFGSIKLVNSTGSSRSFTMRSAGGGGSAAAAGALTERRSQ